VENWELLIGISETLQLLKSHLRGDHGSSLAPYPSQNPSSSPEDDVISHPPSNNQGVKMDKPKKITMFMAKWASLKRNNWTRHVKGPRPRVHCTDRSTSDPTKLRYLSRKAVSPIILLKSSSIFVTLKKTSRWTSGIWNHLIWSSDQGEKAKTIWYTFRKPQTAHLNLPWIRPKFSLAKYHYFWLNFCYNNPHQIHHMEHKRTLIDCVLSFH